MAEQKTLKKGRVIQVLGAVVDVELHRQRGPAQLLAVVLRLLRLVGRGGRRRSDSDEREAHGEASRRAGHSTVMLPVEPFSS